MIKSTLITVLCTGFIIFLLLFLFKKGDSVLTEKVIIFRDTIVIHDTIREIKIKYLPISNPEEIAGVNVRADSIQSPTCKNNHSDTANPFINAKLSYNIISSQNNTFGYDILMENRVMVHQPSIPALPGNEGFKSMDNATKVAELVIKKIRKNEMPPTITLNELKALNVIE